MKIIHLLLFMFSCTLFIGCNNDDEGNGSEAEAQLLKSKEILYSPYGDVQILTYYVNNKPVVDSTFYLNDSLMYFQKYSVYNYNIEGLLVNKTTYNFNNENQSFVYEYDTQNRMLSVSCDYWTCHYNYNGNSIFGTYQANNSDSHYTMQFDLDENDHIINFSKNEVYNVEAVYSNNELTQWIENNGNTQISYLDIQTPEFMMHPEIGDYKPNFALLNIELYLQNQLKFEPKLTSSISTQFNNGGLYSTNYEYELNANNIPIHIIIRDVNSDYITYEVFFGLE